MADLLSSTSDMDKAELQSLVAKFVKGGDEQNVEILDDVLHPDYRITFAFPGETKVTILNREVYLQMLRDKKLGGRKRDTTIEDISIRGNVAVVRAKLQSPVMRFNIFFSFINTGSGWKLISDLPFAEMIG
ncbi:lumazine-binding family protein [Leptospira broomii serovar Hurstbridge str. 5399]|uniref:Lumazine-binding family protein n=1 Tax=Leptospira broomii serovar Hurstbridge str. 5399 TaxID=1049789 RepID=T0GAE9_9LEPT|nr:nuclear transport factor 2 family protein [Leptospira broomii]EQA43804.1 lumazine-binding family protein [Leptospira broomii serovar Hurstbridge str. 5399]